MDKVISISIKNILSNSKFDNQILHKCEVDGESIVIVYCTVECKMINIGYRCVEKRIKRST